MFCTATVGSTKRLFQVLSAVGGVVTLAPNVLLAVADILNAEASLNARLDGDTPAFTGEPGFYGGWRVSFTEAI